jgi:uncharacterized protein (DUF1499 family)
MRSLNKFARFCLFLGALGAVFAAMILLGARLGLWQPITGFGLYRNYFTPLVGAVAVLGVIAFFLKIKTRSPIGAAAGVLIAALGIAGLIPLMTATANPPRRAPPIHDITTDTTNPPQFEALDDTRAGATNTLTYGGEEIATAQKAAYPEIAPLATSHAPDAAFSRSIDIAKELGWEIVAADATRGRFEATARTPLFYFADDMVIVVTPDDSGSRIDMRSVSRVGRSDQGVNAARILDFQNRFSQ